MVAEKTKNILDANFIISQPNMGKYVPQFKHEVLQKYTAGDRSHSFEALARRYKIRGGKSLIRKWYQRWNGTPQSLQRVEGSEKRARLTPEQVNKLIVKPFRRSNRVHVAIEYPELKASIEKKLGHTISLRTIQRYGLEAGKISSHTTIARTEKERKFI